LCVCVSSVVCVGRFRRGRTMSSYTARRRRRQ
jgi:hypothetical protein